jgi:hypothetical protein
MLTIEIFNSGEAFDTAPDEIARILRELAARFDAGNPPEVLHDSKGNTCGAVYFDPMTAHTDNE